MYKILDFIGLDAYKYGKFNELEDMFDYTISSKYFNIDIFRLEEEYMNHANRIRNKKRTSYMKFIEYLKTNRSISKFTFNKDKSIYIDLISSYFKVDIKQFIYLINKKVNDDKILHEKFNGYIVNEITKLSGKELGRFISIFKEKYSKPTFDEFIKSVTIEDCRNLIKIEFESFNK